MVESNYLNPHQLTTLLLSNALGRGIKDYPVGVSAPNRHQPRGVNQHNAAQNSSQAFEALSPQHSDNPRYPCLLSTGTKTKRDTSREKICTRLFDTWEESIRHIFDDHYFCALCKREKYDESWGYNLTEEQAQRIKKCFYKEFKYLKDHVMRDHGNFVPCGCHRSCPKKFGLSADRKRHVLGLLKSLKKHARRNSKSLPDYYLEIDATDLGKSGWQAQKSILQIKNSDQWTIFNTANKITDAERLNEYLVQHSREINVKENPGNFLQVPGASSVATSSGFTTPHSPRSPASVFSDDQSCGGVDLPQEDTEANPTSTGFPTSQGLALSQTGVSPSQQHLEPVNEEQDVLSDIVPGSFYDIHSPAGDYLSLYETVQGLQDSVRLMGPEDPQRTLIHNALYHLTSMERAYTHYNQSEHVPTQGPCPNPPFRQYPQFLQTVQAPIADYGPIYTAAQTESSSRTSPFAAVPTIQNSREYLVPNLYLPISPEITAQPSGISQFGVASIGDLGSHDVTGGTGFLSASPCPSDSQYHSGKDLENMNPFHLM